MTTRTPTQVASHAQKYFIRQNSLTKRKRRSSLFDITGDAAQDSVRGITFSRHSASCCNRIRYDFTNLSSTARCVQSANGTSATHFESLDGSGMPPQQRIMLPPPSAPSYAPSGYGMSGERSCLPVAFSSWHNATTPLDHIARTVSHGHSLFPGKPV